MNCKKISEHTRGCAPTILWSRALLRGGVRTSILYIGVYTPPCKHVHTPMWWGAMLTPRPHIGVVIHAPRERR